MDPSATLSVIPPALDLLVETVDRVADDEWDRPSNLDGWTVRDVVAHVTGSVAKISFHIDDAPMSRQPSSPEEWRREDPRAELRSRVADALTRLDSAPVGEVRQSPAGEVPLGIALAFPTVDAVVHAWDVDHSCGRRLEAPDELLDFVERLTQMMGDPAATGAFAPAKPCPAGASRTEQLMASLGRDPGLSDG